MSSKYVAPGFKADGFNCPHCESYTHQKWYSLDIHATCHGKVAKYEVGFASFCMKCCKYAIWTEGKMIYPISSIAPLPVDDMPKDVKEDFEEARNVVNVSPRSAAALLRLALQKLVIHLGEEGKNLNKDIGNLVKKGLEEEIQQALDSVRVIGNNAVHPGQIDMKDDRETALFLFDSMNAIVEKMITRPEKVKRLYEKVPDSIKEAIKERNTQAP